jgi:4'-phosphopantetheinyl transferase
VNDVRVQHITLDAGRDELARCRALLNDEERARADRFRFEVHARHFTVARAFLRTILGEALAIAPEAVEFAYSDYGKPLLPGGELQFNLSHSDEVAVAAIAPAAVVGIDVERVRVKDNALELATRFFAPDEVEALRRVPAGEIDHAFFRCWTAKEAYIKARGQGISLGLDTFAVSLDADAPRLLRADDDDPRCWTMQRVPVPDGYLCTMAVGSPERTRTR